MPTVNEYMDRLERLSSLDLTRRAEQLVALERRHAARLIWRAEREAKKQKKAAATPIEATLPTEGEPRPDEAATQKPPRVRSRYVPVALRDRILDRADHRCEYTGLDGARCRERAGLAMDHIQPFGRGGRTEESNLRALCAAHNQWHAERCFGGDFMKRKIAAEMAHRTEWASARSG